MPGRMASKAGSRAVRLPPPRRPDGSVRRSVSRCISFSIRDKGSQPREDSMKGLMRPRRSLWLGLGLGLGIVTTVVAAVAAVAAAGLQPAELGFTPNSESQMTNIAVARAYAKNYYGAPTATSGTGVSWNTPLNLTSNYADEARSVAKQGDNWLSARSKVSDRAIVLDVDDTTLTPWNQ